MNDTDGEVLGSVDESLGHYADAFLFRLSEEMCKKLSSGHFIYSFNYEHTEDDGTDGRRRIRLSSISLTGRPAYAKPTPKQPREAAKAEAAKAKV